MRLGNKLRLTSRQVTKFLPEHVASCRQLEEVEQQLAWVRRQLLDSLEDRSAINIYFPLKVLRVEVSSCRYSLPSMA